MFIVQLPQKYPYTCHINCVVNLNSSGLCINPLWEVLALAEKIKDSHRLSESFSHLSVSCLSPGGFKLPVKLPVKAIEIASNAICTLPQFNSRFIGSSLDFTARFQTFRENYGHLHMFTILLQ